MENVITEEQLEKLRNKAKKILHIVIVLSVVSFIVYAGLFYIVVCAKETMSLIWVFKIIVVTGALALGTFFILWTIFAKPPYNKFNESFKSKYVVQTIYKIPGFDKLEYTPKGGFSWDEVKNIGIVDCGNERYFESEDLLFGEYDNVNFKISDVTTKKRVHRDKKDRIEEIFTGQVICLFQFDDIKVSNGYLQIFQNEFLSDISGWKAEHSIHTENEIFNERFNIYASDEHNAYYILTPQRMEKILEFSNSVDGQISLVFYGDKLFVAIKRESMFDAVIDEPVLDQTKKIIEDAEFIKKAKEILVMS